MWTGYLLQKNIQRFEALLDEPTTSDEIRKAVTELLVEAKTELSSLGEDPWVSLNRARDRRD
jgi:hypothetical protein